MPNDAKTKMDQDVHRLQDQPTPTMSAGTGAGDTHATKEDAPRDDRNAPPAQRQPLQSQQRDVTGTTLPDPFETSKDDTDGKLSDHDYGPKTNAAEDHPYPGGASTGAGQG